MRSTALLPTLVLLACQGTRDVNIPDLDPTLGDTSLVVPGPGLPAEVLDQDANNNLDITWHNGRLYLAFRTAPSHFASADTVLYVISSADEQTWRYEASFAMDTDLREPRLMSWNGSLFLYFAVLGDNNLDFEPQGARVSVLTEEGWSEPEDLYEPDFIPWRARLIDGVPYLMGYTGGEAIYDNDGAAIDIHWLTTEDGITWSAVVPDQPVVLTGGGSETDFAFLDDGGLIAVVRNEAGDADGFGSKICRAEPGALGDWTCKADPKKYDSPLVFRHGDEVWLIGRRNVTDTGNFDLSAEDDRYEDMDRDQQSLAYALDYWDQPKRCSLWRVDPDALSVSFVLDLPSYGDTCFAAEYSLDDDSTVVYNYSSPIDGEDISWLEGQTGLTNIYRTEIRWP